MLIKSDKLRLPDKMQTRNKGYYLTDICKLCRVYVVSCNFSKKELSFVCERELFFMETH